MTYSSIDFGEHEWLMILNVQVEKLDLPSNGSIHQSSKCILIAWKSLRLVEGSCTNLNTQCTACKNILIHFQFKVSHLFCHYTCKNEELISQNPSIISYGSMIKFSAVFTGNKKHRIHDIKSIRILNYIPHTISWIRHWLTFNADLVFSFVFIPLSKLFLFRIFSYLAIWKIRTKNSFN